MTNYGGSSAPGQWGGGSYAVSVADAPVETRAEFIRKTYLHLVGAVLAFVALETAFFLVTTPEFRLQILGMVGGGMWLVVLGAFMFVSYIADRFARSPASRPMHYGGLALYVVAQALIFVPLLIIAVHYAPSGTIGSAALVTAIIFSALTAYVFITKQDFSWLGGILWIAAFAAVAVIVAGVLMGWSLGLWFIVPMIAVAAGYILYTTSNILHVYTPGQHVAASLALFASVALLFWYVLQLIMSLQRD